MCDSCSRQYRNNSISSNEEEGADSRIGRQDQQYRDFYNDKILNPVKVDTLIEEEMMNLSFHDRNSISEEIHGVRCLAPPETKNFLERSLDALEIELSKIPPSEKRAFLQAIGNSDQNDSKQTKFVDRDEFRLRFLRCELFDAKKAAKRMVQYLDLIAFHLPFENGLAVLHRPITLSDLSEAEQMLLRKGHLQLLPFRDRSGRRVLTGVASLGIQFDPRKWYKILLYFLFISSDDFESQRNGIVILLFPNAEIAQTKLRYPINSGGRLVQMVLQCVPIRVAAIHFCTPANDPFFKIVRSVFALALVGGRRSRLRFHSGGPIELKYRIKSFGIPVDLLPLTSTGNVKTTYLKQWIRLRNFFEKNVSDEDFVRCIGGIKRKAGMPTTTLGIDVKTGSTDHETLIECPQSTDVVFRPGKPAMNHPGNVAFRSIIESKSNQHEAATQTEKTLLAKQVVDEMIVQKGGRFLVWEERFCCWKAITAFDQQRNKVAIAFRNFKSHKKALAKMKDAHSVSRIFEKLNYGSSDADTNMGTRRKGNEPIAACNNVYSQGIENDSGIYRNFRKFARTSSSASLQTFGR